MTVRSHNAGARLPRRAMLCLAALAAAVPVGSALGAVPQGDGCSRAGTAVTCEFWAKTGTVAVPGGTVGVMGYAPTAAGAPQVPGPTIVAEVGDTVTVTLHNTLARGTAMLFQEQPMRPDLTGVAPGGTGTYTFTPGNAGTYLYEASPFNGNAAQSALGMSGALVVRPSGAAGQAYADPSTAFDAEHLVFVQELDKDLTPANAGTFDMRNYSPEYRLVNGKASPNTAPLPAAAGQKVLLRYVNAGVMAHSMGALGLTQTVVGEDGNALANPRRMTAETLGSGQTDDVLVDAGTAPGRYPVYDAGLELNNNAAAGMGGMLTVLDVTGGTAVDIGPGTTNVQASGATLTADFTADAAAAEFFVDAIGAGGSGTSMTVAGSSRSATGTLPALSGAHTVYVRARDAAGTWGPVSSVNVASSDAAGPVTRSLSLTPNPSNGAADVLLRATGDDTATGGSDIAAGEYTLDGGTPVPVSPNVAGPISALDVTIPASALTGLSEGTHTVSVRSRDTAGNWGAATTIDLVIDTTGPAGSLQALSPAYTNGVQGVTASIPAVRASATFADGASTIAGGEGFIDTVGALGKGFLMVPVDGTWNARSEKLQVDIPLTTITTLPQGSHTVYLRGQDAAGNWGPTVSTPLVVDKVAPTAGTASFAPSPQINTTVAPFTNNPTFTVSLAGTDAASPIAGGEWFIGTDPGAGNGTPMTAAAAALSTTVTSAPLTITAYPNNSTQTFTMRVRDAAGNWSATKTVQVLIVYPDVIFEDGLQSGTASAWSSISNNQSRLSYTTAANMQSAGNVQPTGTVGLTVTPGAGTSTNGNNANSYVTDNSPTAEPTYHARFYFNPNGATPGGSTTSGIGILTGYTGDNGGGSTRFSVRFRVNGGNRQVALQVATGNTTSTSAWTNVTAATPLELFWRAGGNGTTAQFTVGATAITMTGLNTGTNNRIESVRMGALGLSGTRSGTFHLDTFRSTRRSVVGP